MTRSAARLALDTADAAIQRNCADLFEGRIDIDTFRERQRTYQGQIEAAGQRDAFGRRWRARAAQA